MSDDLVIRLRTNAGIDDVHDAADLIEAQAAEIARLRALCDRQITALSLSGMRHGRILVGLERRNRRQRRALAKLYQRRHDKNAALATARQEGVDEVLRIIADFLAAFSRQECCGNVLGGYTSPPECCGNPLYLVDVVELQNAIRVAAKEDRQP